MPVYEAEAWALKVRIEQQLADGRWMEVHRIQRFDSDGGWVEVHHVADYDTGRLRTERVVGRFRAVHVETGEINPRAPTAAALAAGTAQATPEQVVAMVDGLTPAVAQLEDGTWRASFAELPEVSCTAPTEAEARAAARAEAIQIGELVRGFSSGATPTSSSDPTP